MDHCADQVCLTLLANDQVLTTSSFYNCPKLCFLGTRMWFTTYWISLISEHTLSTRKGEGMPKFGSGRKEKEAEDIKSPPWSISRYWGPEQGILHISTNSSSDNDIWCFLILDVISSFAYMRLTYKILTKVRYISIYEPHIRLLRFSFSNILKKSESLKTLTSKT